MAFLFKTKNRQAFFSCLHRCQIGTKFIGHFCSERPLFEQDCSSNIPGKNTHLKSIVGLIPDHHNEASTAIKQVATFLLVEGPAFNL